MNIYIKYMSSARCKILVKEDLEKLGLPHVILEYGVVEIMANLQPEQVMHLKTNLILSGWELMDDKRSLLIEQIKNVIIEMIALGEKLPKLKPSDYISKKLHYDYTYLTNIFAEVQGITIQQFIILQKIEKIKELLLYDDLTLTQISYQLQYSSVAHLSTQFKKVTGLTPTFYKKMKQKRMSNLEKGKAVGLPKG